MPVAARPSTPQIPDDLTEPPDLCGVVLDGRYRVDRPMGRGGMGSVYAGEQLSLGRQIAIKVVRPGSMDRDIQVRRLVQEAKTAAMIRHPNVIEVIDVGLMKHRFVYLVMEHLEGTDLRSVLRAEGKLGWGRTRGIVTQVVAALGAAHAQGVIHRDVKPSNCFLVRGVGPEQEFVKVVDFGLAKRHRGEGESLTGADQVVGTATYLAPEVARGKPADARSEVYSVGVLMYKMLTGRVPFTGPTPIQVLANALSNPVTPPRTHVDSIPRAVDHLVRRCLSKRPEQRPSNMEVLLRELGKLEAADEPVALDAPTLSVPAVTAAIVDNDSLESSASGEVIELRDSEVISIEPVADATQSGAALARPRLWAVPTPASVSPDSSASEVPARRRTRVPPSRALVPIRGRKTTPRRIDAATFDFDFDDDESREEAGARMNARGSGSVRAATIAITGALLLGLSLMAVQLLHPRGLGLLVDPIATRWAAAMEGPTALESEIGAASLTMVARSAVASESSVGTPKPMLKTVPAPAEPVHAVAPAPASGSAPVVPPVEGLSPVAAPAPDAAPVPVPDAAPAPAPGMAPPDAASPSPGAASEPAVAKAAAKKRAKKRARRRRRARARASSQKRKPVAPPPAKPKRQSTAKRNAAPWTRVPTPATRQQRG